MAIWLHSLVLPTIAPSCLWRVYLNPKNIAQANQHSSERSFWADPTVTANISWRAVWEFCKRSHLIHTLTPFLPLFIMGESETLAGWYFPRVNTACQGAESRLQSSPSESPWKLPSRSMATSGWVWSSSYLEYVLSAQMLVRFCLCH